MSSLKKRNVGLDVAKCIAMFCVVLLHFSVSTRAFPNSLSGNAVTSLTAICVPLFFAVNGALLLRKPFDMKKHMRRLVRIVILASFWRLLTLAYVVLVLGSPVPPLRDIVFALLGGNPDGWSLGHFWFLNALIAIYLFLPVLKALYDAKDRKPLWFVCGTIFFFTSCLDSVRSILEIIDVAYLHSYAILLNALSSLNIFGSYGYIVLYFVGGALIADMSSGKLSSALARKLTPKIAVVFSIISAVWIVVLQHYQHVYLGVNFSITYGYWLIPTVVLTLMILYLVLHISQIENRGASKIIDAIGRNTFGIYMLHFPLIWAFARMQDMYPVLQFQNLGNIELLVCNLFGAVGVFFVACVLSWTMSKVPGVRRLLSF